jgi:methyl-accepting chemotaxis protein
MVATTNQTATELVETTDEIAVGIEAVEETVDSLSRIGAAITETATGAKEVASATDDHAASSEEVAAGVDEAVEELATLERQLSELSDIVARQY